MNTHTRQTAAVAELAVAGVLQSCFNCISVLCGAWRTERCVTHTNIIRNNYRHNVQEKSVISQCFLII